MPLSAPRPISILPLLAALALPAAAHAQEAADNAVESAEDAFGTSVGHETIGVYDEGNVRGFSPGNAGNFRMEGMYFDIQGGLGNRVIDGETIRVGTAAQGYAFPAPTGIVDLQLKKAGDRLVVSPFISADSFGAAGLELDVQVPVIDKELSINAGVGAFNNRYNNGGGSKGYNVGIVPRWRPAKGIEVLAFYNRQQNDDETPSAIYIPTGNFLPPRIEWGRYPGPDWATSNSRSDTFGTVGHANLGNWTLRAGLFHSSYRGGPGFSNIVLINPDASSDRLIHANPGNESASWSGELRLSRRFSDGPRQHLITAALRGRSIDATYGGGDSRIVASGDLNAVIHAARPQFTFHPQTGDETRQVTAGIGYSLAWKGLGELTLAVQRSHYVKRVANPGVPITSGTSDVTLPSASAALNLAKGLTLYGSFVRGLEDAGSAPGYAANAYQVLPAIRTEQYDFGLRFSPVKDTTLILGYFSIRKPFIDIDQTNHFGLLGDETHRGLEFSITSNVTHDLRVVAGGVYLDPTVEASPSIAQAIGKHPVNQQRLRTRFNVNWTLPFARALTLDAYVNHDAGAYATVDNSLYAPGSTRIGMGARYKFELGGKPVTARVTLFNIFNAYEVIPVASGVYAYNTKRNVAVWLAMDL